MQAKKMGDRDAKCSNVRVVVRCRPLTPQEEKEKQSKDSITFDRTNEVSIKTDSNSNGKEVKKTSYRFDSVFKPDSSQEEVYNSAVKPLVLDVLAGYNCTAFAYGTTGTGKTHTMIGELKDGKLDNPGVIPRAIDTIFDNLNGRSLDYSVKVSSLQLYNDTLSDLLSNTNEQKDLKIAERSDGDTYVSNLVEKHVANAKELFSLFQQSQSKRQTAQTLLNTTSSRSHCVFIITVETKETNEDGEEIFRTGKLYLVDLAGSEDILKSGAKDERAKEAGKINKDLLSLEIVFKAIVEETGHVPYRRCNLTFLLKGSLGGKSKTVMIATISPAGSAIDQSKNTLKYAHDAKSIKNKPQVNQTITNKAYVKELEADIKNLKRENECLRLKNGIHLPPEQYDALIARTKEDGVRIEEYLGIIHAKENAMKEIEKSDSQFAGSLTKHSDISMAMLGSSQSNVQEISNYAHEFMQTAITTTTAQSKHSITALQSLSTNTQVFAKNRIDTHKSLDQYMADFIQRQQQETAKLTTQLVNSVHTLIMDYQQKHTEMLSTAITSIRTQIQQECLAISAEESQLVQENTQLQSTILASSESQQSHFIQSQSTLSDHLTAVQGQLQSCHQNTQIIIQNTEDYLQTKSDNILVSAPGASVSSSHSRSGSTSSASSELPSRAISPVSIASDTSEVLEHVRILDDSTPSEYVVSKLPTPRHYEIYSAPLEQRENGENVDPNLHTRPNNNKNQPQRILHSKVTKRSAIPRTRKPLFT